MAFLNSMKLSNTALISIASLIVVALSGCQSAIPEEIRLSRDNAPGLEQVRENPESFINQGVRWGGLILDIENRQNSSRLTVMAQPLNDNGRPSQYEASAGRFIAEIGTFLEPMDYARDRRVTFIGSIVGTETLKVGEYPYTYPVIQVDQHYLWPKTLPSSQLYPNYWRYDPWYYSGFSPWYYPYKHHPTRLVPINR
jgi:outer membrane lipoprotein